MVAERTDENAQMNMAGVKRLCASSNAKTIPVKGALKATASPAHAPPVNWYLRSISVHFNILLVPSPHVAPINMLGPSAPAVSPDTIQTRHAATIDGRDLYHFNSNKPLAAPSVCGIPLPRTIGTYFESVDIKNAIAASAIKSNGIKAGFSRISEYRSFAYFASNSAAMVKNVTIMPRHIPVIIPTAISWTPWRYNLESKFVFVIELPISSNNYSLIHRQKQLIFIA